MTGTTTTPPTVLIGYDTTGYPHLPSTAPVPRVLRPAGSSGRPGNHGTRRWIRSVAGAAAFLLVASVAVRCSGIGPSESPESLVRSVFAALTAHDGQRLRDLSGCDGSPLCTAGGLATGYQAPEHFDIVSAGRDKDHRSIMIGYTIGGTAAKEPVELTRYRTGVLGHRWHISKLPGARLDLRTVASEQIHVAGATVTPNPVEDPAGGVHPQLFAPPGAYTVAIDGDTLFAATAATVVVAAGIDTPPTVITPTLRPELQSQIEHQVKDRITYCAGLHDFHPYVPQWRTSPDTCPLMYDPPSPFTNPPTWTIERLPTITLSVDEHARIKVRTTTTGTAVVRYQWSLKILEPRQWTDAASTVEFTIDGTVGVKDNAPIFIG